MGAMAYDPRRLPRRTGAAALATQLFQNGELWLASNTMIVRERGGRRMGADTLHSRCKLEAIFFEKTHAAIAFAVNI